MHRFSAFAAALLFASPLMAAEGASTTYLNVRAGPGGGNPVVGGLAPGDVVQILTCNADNWCQIAGAGQEGWVASRYLTAAPSAGEADPRCRWDLDTSGIEPVFRATCPPGVVPPAPPPPPGDLACFYTEEAYAGTRTCLDPGDYMTLEPDVNDAISSVQVQGEARVRLCTDPDLGGICMDWLENTTTLDRRLQDTASSIKVYVGFLPPPPPPPPIVHMEGTVELTENGRANLDTGQTGPAGADIWWRGTGDAATLTPVNGAQVSIGTGADRSLHDCRKEGFTETPVTLTNFAPGTVLCIKTNMGRTGRVELGEAGSDLSVDFVTWGE